jgi:hypothetical protein
VITFEAPPAAKGRERRVHHRLSSDELSTPASIRIPNHPPVSLVDLSPGGALLDMPFQIRPDSRVTVEFRAASERMMLPFRLLRCYVTSLKGGVYYQAAGEFVHGLDWKPLLADVAAQTATSRLIATLEAFLRHASTTGRTLEFDHLLMWVLDAASRAEGADRIAVEIRLRLGRIIPSLVIEPATTPTLPDPTRGARFFGFDFRCERALTTPDRRILRAAAHLLSIVKADEASRKPQPLDFKPRQTTASDLISYSVADWQDMRQADGSVQGEPWERSA